MQTYKSQQWREFRSKVILLDNDRCVQCGRGERDHVDLHVHHKVYRKGCLPWEYAFEDCETLCAGCHAAHHGKIPPKVGWEFAGHDDLGDLSGNCDLCGTEIRHLFLVYHPDWPEMEVGEVCCDHLTCSEVASNHMDSIRGFNERRKRFVGSPRWQLFRCGHEYLTQQHIFVEVREVEGGFRLRMNGVEGKQLYLDGVAAKARAFDVLESVEHADFMKRVRRSPAPRHKLLMRP